MAGTRNPQQVVRQGFLWGIAAIYLFAFTSLYVQIPGLYGNDGLLSASYILHDLSSCTDKSASCSLWSSYGECNKNKGWMIENCMKTCNSCQALDTSFSALFRKTPTLLWLTPYLGMDTPSGMELLCILGIVLSFVLLVSQRCRDCLGYLMLWFLYYSMLPVGQIFLHYQWDALLWESGFLAFLVAPWNIVIIPWRCILFKCRRFRNISRHHDSVTLWLVKWLLFRLMFASGVVKLTYMDKSWWDLSALNWHYESQCIPTPVAWYFQKLPTWFHRFSVVMTYVIEIGIPFLAFAPIRILRTFAYCSEISLQLLILLTGNYNFFNLLTMVLCVSLLDDRCILSRIQCVFCRKCVRSNCLNTNQQTKPSQSEADNAGYVEVKQEDNSVEVPQDETQLNDVKVTEAATSGVSPNKDTVGSPIQRTAGSPNQQTAGYPNEQTADSPSEQTAGSPNQQTTGSPNEQTADSPNQQTAGYPNEQTADSPSEQTAGSPNQQTTGSPNEQTADSPNQQTAGSPNEQTADSPNKQTAGSPNQQTNGSPNEQTADSPNQQTAGSPNQQTADSPNQQTAGSPNEETADSPNKQTADSPNEQTADSQNEQTADSLNQQTAGSSNQQTPDSPNQQTADSKKASAISFARPPAEEKSTTSLLVEHVLDWMNTRRENPKLTQAKEFLHSQLFGWIKMAAVSLSFLAVLIVFMVCTIKWFNIKITAKEPIHSETAFTPEQLVEGVQLATQCALWIGFISLVVEILGAITRCLLEQCERRSKVWQLFQCVAFSLIAVWMFAVSLYSFTAVDRVVQRNLPTIVVDWYRKTEYLELTNAYGLFRSMTGVGGRPEVIIKGSNSLKGPWEEYNFLYKPGNVYQPPPFVAPHQPRLDWQMWFAALESYSENPWFLSLIHKLLLGKEDVLQLMGKGPFDKSPPRFIRAELYLYHYTHNSSSLNQLLLHSSGEKAWWTREFVREYVPFTVSNSSLSDLEEMLEKSRVYRPNFKPEITWGILYPLIRDLRGAYRRVAPTTLMNAILCMVVTCLVLKVWWRRTGRRFCSPSLTRARDKSEPSLKAASRKRDSNMEKPADKCCSICGNCLCCVNCTGKCCELYRTLNKKTSSCCQVAHSKLTEKLHRCKAWWKSKLASVKKKA